MILLSSGPLDAKLTWDHHPNARRERVGLWLHDGLVGNYSIAPDYSLAVDGAGKFTIAHGHQVVGQYLDIHEPTTQQQLDNAFLTVVGGLLLNQCREARE